MPHCCHLSHLAPTLHHFCNQQSPRASCDHQNLCLGTYFVNSFKKSGLKQLGSQSLSNRSVIVVKKRHYWWRCCCFCGGNGNLMERSANPGKEHQKHADACLAVSTAQSGREVTTISFIFSPMKLIHNKIKKLKTQNSCVNTYNLPGQKLNFVLLL